MIADGKRPRLRKPAADRPKEIVLHMQVASLLRQAARREWRWTHIPSGEHRDIRTAAKLKQMGTMRGWPDFILLSPEGVAHSLELKRRGGQLSEAQAEFRAWAEGHELPYAVADNFDAALAILKQWGAI